MSTRALLLVLALPLAACGGGQPPVTSSGATTAGPSSGPGPGPASGPGPGSASGQTTPPGGPLAALDPATAKQETWQLERGPAPFLNFEAQQLRISAGCRAPNGQLDCEALRFARGGPTVTLTSQEKMRMGAPGAAVCMHIKNQLTTGRDPKGNEDGFCVFGDGSMIATGSLAYHTLK